MEHWNYYSIHRCSKYKITFLFEMTFIDVGQGDGIYMETPEGTTVLIDGGSSDNKKLYEYTLEPFLLSKGRKNLDAVIVTHCDNDHISGIRKIFTEDFVYAIYNHDG